MTRNVVVAVVLGVGLALPAATASGAPAPARSITMVFAGDVLLHDQVNDAAARDGRASGSAYDYGSMFAAVAPVIAAADLAVCHLETPVAPPGEPLSGYPAFGVPAEIAPALAAAGFDRCSTASNHALDRGIDGVVATLDALDASGIGHAGTARTPEEAEPSIITVAGLAVAHLSYTESLNGISPPRSAPWAANRLDPERVVADAHAARLDGAEVVVVSLHWGVEYQHDPSPAQRAAADVITASGAVDLVVGHHAHVLQPIERVNRRWVVFGMGNFLSNQATPARQDGALVAVRLTERRDGSGFTASTPVVMPTWVERGPFVIHDVLGEVGLDTDVRGQLEASRARTEAVLGEFVGAGYPPPPLARAPALILRGGSARP